MRYLRTPLRSPDLELRAHALVRWAKVTGAWGAVAVVLAVAWVVGFSAAHARGYAWVAAPVGLLAGSGLPLQVLLPRISRAAR